VKGPDGGVLQEGSQSTETEYVTVHKVLEADAEGHATKWRVHVKEWKQSEGAGTDTSLQGALLEVTGRMKTQKWTLLSNDVTPSPAGKVWLDDEFGPEDHDEEETTRMFLPAGPVAVGEAWRGDAKGLVTFVSEGLTVDAERATLDVKLVKVEDGRATLAIESKMPVTGAGGVTLPEPGTFSIGTEVSIALEGRVGAESGRTKIEFDLTTNDRGRTTSLRVDVENSRETTLGGEVPEPPGK
jgi:hypothetical protein